MLGLVAAEEAAGLDLGGGAAGELLVEADDALHADGIGGGADGLSVALSAYPFLVIHSFNLRHRVLRGVRCRVRGGTGRG